MEWLTTGQMIDRLKVGEIAECQDPVYLNVKRFTEGLHWVTKEGKRSSIHTDFLSANQHIISKKWRLLPKYVSFEEAMNALQNRKTLALHLEEDGKPAKTLIRKWFHLESREGIKFEDLFNGKWTIED